MKMMVMGGVLFILSIQPMMIIVSLIFIVLLYTLFLLWMMSSFWLSYMIVLVLMSGVLVVFTYMMSVLPNESFEVSSLVFMMMSMIMMSEFLSKDEFMLEGVMGSMKIWDAVTLVISMFLVMYLLAMMVMVVWLSIMEKGAIRIS